jgi:HAD superfamily hydrolase (TIGR01509 family)
VTANQPDAVLWDMDGTILDSEKLWDVALGDLAVHLDRPLTAELRGSLIGGSAADTLAALFAAWRLEPTGANRAYVQGWLDRRVIELYAEPIPWRPGAKDALGLVRQAGLATALVTNTKRTLTEYGLDAIGREYFDASVCGDEVDRGKPAPEGYLRAARLLGVDPARCVAIEDSPTGAAAAQAAGCALIVVPCEIPVPTRPGRVFRTTLEGLTLDDLAAALAARV